MNPIDPNEILGSMDFSDLDNLDEVSDGGVIMMPEGVKVAEPIVTREAVLKKVKSQTVLRTNHLLGMRSWSYNERGGYLATHFIKENEKSYCLPVPSGYEYLEPILDYHPYSVRHFRGMVLIRDLHNGDPGSANIDSNPELNGFSEMLSRRGQFGDFLKGRGDYDQGHNQHPVACAIDILDQLGNYTNRIIKKGKTIIRKPMENLSHDIWYFPLWEVPIKILPPKEKKYNWGVGKPGLGAFYFDGVFGVMFKALKRY